MSISISEAALLAACSEDMYSYLEAEPPLDIRLLGRWQITRYISALDALFGGQAIGLGDRVYYGFVAHSLVNPKDIAVVIRGTANALEWIENIEGFMIPGPDVGMVEQGFWSIYSSMQFGVSDIPDGSDICIIGHSLGAALATYYLHDLCTSKVKKSWDVGITAYLFASPKPGNPAFAKHVDELAGTENYRSYAYIRDIVPHVPPAFPFGFANLPGTEWITPLTAKAFIHNDPECNHHVLSYAAMLEGPVEIDDCVLRGKVALPHLGESHA